MTPIHATGLQQSYQFWDNPANFGTGVARIQRILDRYGSWKSVCPITSHIFATVQHGSLTALPRWAARTCMMLNDIIIFVEEFKPTMKTDPPCITYLMTPEYFYVYYCRLTIIDV